jgi:hypothetical protein
MNPDADARYASVIVRSDVHKASHSGGYPHFALASLASALAATASAGCVGLIVIGSVAQ